MHTWIHADVFAESVTGSRGDRRNSLFPELSWGKVVSCDSSHFLDVLWAIAHRCLMEQTDLENVRPSWNLHTSLCNSLEIYGAWIQRQPHNPYSSSSLCKTTPGQPCCLQAPKAAGLWEFQVRAFLCIWGKDGKSLTDPHCPVSCRDVSSQCMWGNRTQLKQRADERPPPLGVLSSSVWGATFSGLRNDV